MDRMDMDDGAHVVVRGGFRVRLGATGAVLVRSRLATTQGLATGPDGDRRWTGADDRVRAGTDPPERDDADSTRSDQTEEPPALDLDAGGGGQPPGPPRTGLPAGTPDPDDDTAPLSPLQRARLNHLIVSEGLEPDFAEIVLRRFATVREQEAVIDAFQRIRRICGDDSVARTFALGLDARWSTAILDGPVPLDEALDLRRMAAEVEARAAAFGARSDRSFSDRSFLATFLERAPAVLEAVRDAGHPTSVGLTALIEAIDALDARTVPLRTSRCLPSLMALLIGLLDAGTAPRDAARIWGEDRLGEAAVERLSDALWTADPDINPDNVPQAVAFLHAYGPILPTDRDEVFSIVLSLLKGLSLDEAQDNLEQDLARRDAAAFPELLERWRAAGGGERLDPALRDAAEAMLAHIEQRFRDIDFGAGAIRASLKRLASFILSAGVHNRGRSGSVAEAANLLATLLLAVEGKSRRPSYVVDAAAFIVAHDYRQSTVADAVALMAEHGLTPAASRALGDMRRSPVYRASDVDLVASPRAGEVIAYLAVAPGDPQRNGAVAALMVAFDMSAAEAVREDRTRSAAERRAAWFPFVTGTGSGNLTERAILLEDQLETLLAGEGRQALPRLGDVLGPTLRALIVAGHDPQAAFDCVETVLTGFGIPPLSAFLDGDDEEAEAWMGRLSFSEGRGLIPDRAARQAVERFPSALIERLSREGMNPSAIAALLTDHGVRRSSLAILAGVDAPIHGPRLREVLDILAGSDQPSSVRRAIAEAVLRGAEALDDLAPLIELRVRAGFDRAAALAATIETDLARQLREGGVLGIHLDVRTGETFALPREVTVGDMTELEAWLRERSGAVLRLDPSPACGGYAMVAADMPFEASFPGCGDVAVQAPVGDTADAFGTHMVEIVPAGTRLIVRRDDDVLSFMLPEP